MKYGLLNLTSWDKMFVVISEEKYSEIRTAASSLTEVTHIEEKFDIVMENMLDFEMELLRATEASLLFARNAKERIPRESLGINRRIVNLLTACRLYLDHTNHHLHDLFGKTSRQVSMVNRRKTRQYDEYFSYRFMEAMRNYVQHRGYPIDGLAFQSEDLAFDQTSDFINPLKKIRYDIIPTLSVENLRQDGRFKKSVLDEAASRDGSINVKYAAREYIECISRIHHVIRLSLKTRLVHWEEMILGAAATVERTTGSPTDFVAVVARDEDGRCSERLLVALWKILDHRKRLESKNKDRHDFLSQSFVSSEAIMEDHPRLLPEIIVQTIDEAIEVYPNLQD